MNIPKNCVWSIVSKWAVTKYFDGGETLRLCMTLITSVNNNEYDPSGCNDMSVWEKVQDEEVWMCLSVTLCICFLSCVLFFAQYRNMFLFFCSSLCSFTWHWMFFYRTVSDFLSVTHTLQILQVITLCSVEHILKVLRPLTPHDQVMMWLPASGTDNMVNIQAYLLTQRLYFPIIRNTSIPL